jgi:hypothetical protein
VGTGTWVVVCPEGAGGRLNAAFVHNMLIVGSDSGASDAGGERRISWP